MKIFIKCQNILCNSLMHIASVHKSELRCRWGHGGYKEMHPEEFNSSLSESSDSESPKNKRHKKKRLVVYWVPVTTSNLIHKHVLVLRTSAQARKRASEKSTLALKPRADVTRSPKQGYQWPHKRLMSYKNFKKKKKKNMCSL